MSLSDILNKITEEAQSEIREIENKNRNELEKLEENYYAELEKRKQEIVDNIGNKKHDIDRRMSILISMEGRNQLLKAKQEKINIVFEQALERMFNLSDEKYEEILVKNFKILPKLDHAEIIPAKSKKAITEKALKKVGGNFTIGKEGDFRGGFILKSPKIEINGTFEEIIKGLKPALEPQIASILFKEIYVDIFK
jgi:V/A-type H+-transporting ATPase subunit E